MNTPEPDAQGLPPLPAQIGRLLKPDLKFGMAVFSPDQMRAYAESAVTALRAENAELRAQVERLTKDAERLDFLGACPATRNEDRSPMRRWLWARPFGTGNLRKAIDSALTAQPQGEPK